MHTPPGSLPSGSVGPTITKPDIGIDEEQLTRLLPPYRVVVVTPDGQTVFAPTFLEVAQQASKRPSDKNFIFKVGEKVAGKLR